MPPLPRLWRTSYRSAMTVAGAIGGGVSYLVASAAGAPSIPSYIGGATTAFVVVCLTSPVGSALMWFFQLDQCGSVTRSLVSLLG